MHEMNPEERGKTPEGQDPEAIEFRWSEAGPEPEAAPKAEESIAAPSESGELEIKWRDENQAPEAGKPATALADPGQGSCSAARRSLPWVRLLWGFIPLALILGGFAAVMLTQGGVGHAWDEAYYYEPAELAGDWLVSALRGERPFSQEAIDRAWAGPNGEFGHGYNEHPSVQKILSGLSLRFFPEPKMRLFAMRLPIAILFGLTLALIYLLGRRAWRPAPGVIAALLYATMPRIFGHAHFASMETPLNFMMLLTVFCFLKGLERPLWAAATGVAFGALLATKINGFFLPIPLILWAHLYARRQYANNLFAMIFMGPVVFVLCWPWLWPDPVMRMLQYLAFHARHQMTASFFLGQKWGYGDVNAPWFYPLAVTGATLPLTALALIGLGVARTLAALPRRPLEALYLLCALTMLGVACAPGTPKYDMERLFLPLFPFLALLGGSGAVAALGGLQRLAAWGAARRKGAGEINSPRAVSWAALALGALILLDGGGAIWRHRPYHLSYFNPLVGGLSGVYENKLFETTYWGEALNEDVIAALNALPPGTTIKPLALHAKCLQDLQLWGMLDGDLLIDKPKRLITGGVPVEYYDYHLLLMRQGFFTRPERALAERGRFKGMIWKKDGVPMIGLYPTGLEFETFWRGM